MVGSRWDPSSSWEEVLERLSTEQENVPERDEPKERLDLPCPTCGATGVTPLVFGLLSPEGVDQERRGRIHNPG